MAGGATGGGRHAPRVLTLRPWKVLEGAHSWQQAAGNQESWDPAEVEEGEEDAGGGGRPWDTTGRLPSGWGQGFHGTRRPGWQKVLRAVQGLSRAGSQVWAAPGWWEMGALWRLRGLGSSVGICRNGKNNYF